MNREQLGMRNENGEIRKTINNEKLGVGNREWGAEVLFVSPAADKMF
jgi:hypothetical protein